MKVSPLRQRMLDAMQMRGYSPRTHDSYIQAVLDLSRYYQRLPDAISADEVQQWLLWLLKERHVSSSTCHLYFNGVRFLYVTVLEAFRLGKKALPDGIPSLNQVIRNLAELGGLLGRKCDGEPGAKSIWIDYSRVLDCLYGIQMANELADE